MEVIIDQKGYDYDSSYACMTPKDDDCRIPVADAPPPPPKKSRSARKADPPINGYFNTPDLELIFKKLSHYSRHNNACYA
ncbi:hypothetical protein RND81_01G013800 [Saponaria officinalis]|uniref:Uncharacterized protein n=1 Tax=Saponaria officinalis TaxID=3572 RepID=A0AAW1NBN3_SAPOF